MAYWLELALVVMLCLSTFALTIQVYYIWISARLIAQLATDAVHLKLLVSLAAAALAKQGLIVMGEEEVVAQMPDELKAKMN